MLMPARSHAAYGACMTTPGPRRALVGVVALVAAGALGLASGGCTGPAGECTGGAGNVRLFPGAPHPVDEARDLQIAIQYFLPGSSPRRVKLMLLGKGGSPTPTPASSDGYDVGVGDRFTWGGASFEVRDICGTDVTLELTKATAAPS